MMITYIYELNIGSDWIVFFKVAWLVFSVFGLMRQYKAVLMSKYGQTFWFTSEVNKTFNTFSLKKVD